MKDLTRNMLRTMRNLTESNRLASKKNLLTEESESKDGDTMVISKNTPQFGDVRTSQEEALVKTIGESIEMDENALVYKPSTKDLILSGKITALNIVFQFRYNDPSGDGCYIWVTELQLTESNQRTLGKIRDGFLNWKQSLLQNGDLLEKMHQAATEQAES